jgi:riboflavin transporter FmnP
MKNNFTKQKHIKALSAVGLFCALAYVCCVLFHFKAAFLTFDLKDAVMAVGAMIFGPVYGVAMALIVAIIEGITISSTGVYGFIMNVLSSITFVGIASIIYKLRRTMSGAVIGIIAASLSMVAVMMAANVLITPFYMNVPRGEVIALIPTLLLPFNLTKAIFNSAVVFIIYKPIITAMRHAGFVVTEARTERSEYKRPNIAVTIIAICVAAATLLFFFLKLNGSFTFG